MEGGVDRISNLPDDILVKIISSYQLKLFIINIHNPKLEGVSTRIWLMMLKHKGKKRFVEFIHQTLLHLWINFVFKRGVQELELDFINPHHYYEIPIGFFHYQGMAVLKIFSMLMNLHLTSEKLTSKFHNEVIKNCLLLKDLYLEKCYSLNYGILLGELITNIPSLQLVEYFGHLIPFSMEQIPFVQHVELNFEPEHAFVNVGVKLAKRLWYFNNTMELIICSFFLQVSLPIYNFLQSLPITLNYLKHLTIKANLHRGLSGIEFLLKISPNLETLSIEIGKGRQYIYYLGGVEIPFFSQNYRETKRPKFECFGSKNELEFIQYVLKNAMVLEKLIINLTRKGVSDEYHSTLLVTAQEIQDYPKASLHAEVLIQ
ncbi:hypothetical protein NE237_033023 [Protea cynaroides]|uniref:FBD domain-containing protein n=1 Tax=Protea cynaroides TaxID=273540 RepID=A0A9Q0L558_9MAGN|nr:hypothetical protein NE237_033023 [Protea cynaroides]